jgi:hypothetical protein
MARQNRFAASMLQLAIGARKTTCSVDIARGAKGRENTRGVGAGVSIHVQSADQAGNSVEARSKRDQRLGYGVRAKASRSIR